MQVEPRKAPGSNSGRKRLRVVAAATEVFLKSGFLGANMDEIAVRAGVSKQTIYKNFGSKEALFVDVVTAMMVEADQKVHTAPAEPDSTEAMERYLFEYAYRQLSVALTPELMQLRRLVIGELGRFPELARILYERGPERAITVLAAVFKRLEAKGLLLCPDATVAATNFNWLFMAHPVNRAMLLGDAGLPSDADMQRLAKEAVRVFLAAHTPNRIA
ncbi:TetR/AcrR family transcriptional regulator [Pelagibacterium lentulum]|uniref:TetR family transcriptional regulator n=1 Tax=Pelagibacterium lentulum TaxID=2029865 RepID=A0A916RK97_9HYPH|nr:TetR/AcrR family transcriptional regulator [Pelagibacterium lentulum]GGA59548.1 TetR family transcriptional regulator [Pelagibacterium lentulum]